MVETEVYGSRLSLGKGGNSTNSNVHPVRNDNDISMCNRLCKSVHGFSREMELRQAKDQGVVSMIEKDNIVTGYAAGIGIFCHAVAKSNESRTPDAFPSIFGILNQLVIVSPAMMELKEDDHVKTSLDLLRNPDNGGNKTAGDSTKIEEAANYCQV